MALEDVLNLAGQVCVAQMALLELDGIVIVAEAGFEDGAGAEHVTETSQVTLTLEDVAAPVEECARLVETPEL